jgi:hypothetical protein
MNNLIGRFSKHAFKSVTRARCKAKRVYFDEIEWYVGSLAHFWPLTVPIFGRVVSPILLLVLCLSEHSILLWPKQWSSWLFHLAKTKGMQSVCVRERGRERERKRERDELLLIWTDFLSFWWAVVTWMISGRVKTHWSLKVMLKIFAPHSEEKKTL